MDLEGSYRSTDNVCNFVFVSKYYSFQKVILIFTSVFNVPILHTLMSCIALFNRDFVCNIVIIAELIHREVVSTLKCPWRGSRRGKETEKESERDGALG